MPWPIIGWKLVTTWVSGRLEYWSTKTANDMRAFANFVPVAFQFTNHIGQEGQKWKSRACLRWHILWKSLLTLSQNPKGFTLRFNVVMDQLYTAHHQPQRSSEKVAWVLSRMAEGKGKRNNLKPCLRKLWPLMNPFVPQGLEPGSPRILKP